MPICIICISECNYRVYYRVHSDTTATERKGVEVKKIESSRGSWVRLPLYLLELLSIRAAVTLSIMIDRQAPDGTVAVSATYLAKTMHVSVRTVRNALQELKDYGYITDVTHGAEPVYKVVQILEPKRRYTT